MKQKELKDSYKKKNTAYKICQAKQKLLELENSNCIFQETKKCLPA